MEFIRKLEIWYYSGNRKFTNQAFKPHPDDSCVSLIERDCSEEISSTACRHLRRYYCENLKSAPVLYWVFDSEILAEVGEKQPRLEQSPSASGDNCHYNLRDFDDKLCRKIRRKIRVEDCFICREDESRPATMESLDELKRRWDDQLNSTS